MESLLNWGGYDLPDGSVVKVRELLDDEKALLSDTEGDGQRQLLMRCTKAPDGSAFFKSLDDVKACPARITLALLNLVIKLSGFGDDGDDEGKG